MQVHLNQPSLSNNSHGLTFSFVNSKVLSKAQTSQTINLQSVHPYTVMALPLHSSQINLKDSAGVNPNKKSSQRNSLGS